jgi:FAD/FMN-containing dehydrogenase
MGGQQFASDAVLVDTSALHRCSRAENAELFGLAIGGYGLFGVITSVRLRLARRRKLERVVEIADVADLPVRFEERIAAGFLYGDCQYSTDLASEDGLRRGVFSCYRPVAYDVPISPDRKEFARDDWVRLLELAHRDRTQAFELYSRYYHSTSSQIYWTDTHQLSTHIDDYHQLLSSRMGAESQGSEMISEIYVPRTQLARFLARVRADFLEHRVNLIYGTIRLIERDDERFQSDWYRYYRTLFG